MSMFARLCVGIFGVILTIGILVNIVNGSLTLQGRYGWLMPFVGIAFIAYAVGGQKLLRKNFPILAEKDKEKAEDEQST